MAANDLEYGWYKWQDGFRQKDGFFVDVSGRVLYWPTKAPPGHVIAEQQLPWIDEQVERNLNRTFKYRFVLGAVFVSSIVLAFFVWTDFIERYGYFFVIFIWAAWFAGDALIKSSAGLGDREHLARLPEFPEPRPRARDQLIPMKIGSRGKFYRGVLFQLALAVVFLAALVYLGRDAYSDYVRYGDSSYLRWVGPLLFVAGLHMVGSAAKLVRNIREWRTDITPDELLARIKVKDGLTPDKLKDVEDRAVGLADAEADLGPADRDRRSPKTMPLD